MNSPNPWMAMTVLLLSGCGLSSHESAPSPVPHTPQPVAVPDSDPTDPLPDRDWPGCEDILQRDGARADLNATLRPRASPLYAAKLQSTATERVVQDLKLSTTRELRVKATASLQQSSSTVAAGDASTLAVLAYGDWTAATLLLIDPSTWTVTQQVPLPLVGTDNPKQRASRADLRFNGEAFAVAVIKGAALNWFEVDPAGEILAKAHYETSHYVAPRITWAGDRWATLVGRPDDAAAHNVAVMMAPGVGDPSDDIIWFSSPNQNRTFVIRRGELVWQGDALHFAGVVQGPRYSTSLHLVHIEPGKEPIDVRCETAQ